MTDEEPILLVMGSGDRRFREYLLASASRRNRLWLFDPDSATWQRPYIVGESVFDVFDPAAATQAATVLAREHRIAGVYCYHEAVILAAAHVAAALGLPGPSVGAVTAVRDKSRTRRLLTEAGLPQPGFALVDTLDGAREAARELGYPLVAKPCSLGASQGVVKVRDEADLPQALAISRSATQRGMTTGTLVLLEQYLAGPEISVDAAVFDDGYQPFAVARKQIGDEPFFEEIGHVVAADDELLADQGLLDLLAAAHRAVGWSDGVTHTEVKFTEDGPVVVEINGRLGGDLIPYLGQLATGIDPGQAAVDLALGVPPKLEPLRRQTAAIRFLYPPVDCRVRGVTLPRPHEIPGLAEAVVLAEPGSVLRLPPGGYVARYGLLIARGLDAESCAAALAAAQAEAVCDHEPLPAAK
jgi:biotin carboxylase